MAVNSGVQGDSSTKRRVKLPERNLAPLNPITYIDPTGLATLSPEEISPNKVGWKAYGLSSVPAEWIPKFLVISADCFSHNNVEEDLQAVLGQGLSQAGIGGSTVMLRSSGTAETIQYRGRLFSKKCTREEIVATASDWTAKFSTSIPGRVHWVVQEYVDSKRRGHLSNERRVSKEKRDWVAEFELTEEAPGYSIPIAVRRWRDGVKISDSQLSCTSELEISFCLKRLAMWAERLVQRMHFEWVWNGSAIRVVQADIADSSTGVDPATLLPAHIPKISIESLSAFKAATSEQYNRYGKLRNARMYKDLGYAMPIFYVLDDPKALSAILGGTVPSNVETDLAELTKRPLILRTDGTNIPSSKREMLPRSDELRTTNDAKNWLLGRFRSGIEKGELENSSLCLIGHHFIPSVASAWARAEPGKRLVRIEALWGLPEGLYWYSHDTYEVDTRDVRIERTKSGTKLKYDSWERLRFKGTFIAPDAAGKWVPYQSSAPFDWRPTISRRDWLFEIAHATRLIAEDEKFPVAVMWFIGNHPDATPHRVLPWFHNRSELGQAPKAAPRRKITFVGDFKLQDASDWNTLKDQVAAGKPVERVIVEPTDCDLIRNQDFTLELANFAAANNIVIELAGGVLSHAYYVLHRQCTQVECTDLFGAEEDILEYNKLVRDRIPAIIEARGERVEVAQLTGDALTSALRQKLVEEALEALDAKSGDDLVGELADLEEVISGLRRALGLTKDQIETERADKKRRRGGFQRGYMLKTTATPHSLEKKPVSAEATLDLKPKGPSSAIISRSEDIPSAPTYRRPDLRQHEHEIEKLFAFESAIKKVTDVTETVDFSLPGPDGNSQEFSLIVEIRRNGASLRSSVRLRLRPPQLMIDFPDNQLKLNFPKKD